MAANKFTPASFFVRLLIAAILVFASYNPVEPYSFYHWAIKPLIDDVHSVTILKGLMTVVLLIGWGVFLNATYKSLGFFGTILVAAFFALSFWWMIDQGWISLNKPTTLSWLILSAVSLVLAAGVSWSHIRRKLTGQYDVDEAGE